MSSNSSMAALLTASGPACWRTRPSTVSAFLISSRGHERILAVFQEARALVLAHELDEGRRVRLPVLGEALEIFKDRADAGVREQATASSVYLSKSVSKMPWYMK